MAASHVFRALHFLEAADGALELERPFAGSVEVLRLGGSGGEQFDVVLVKRIDQLREADCLVLVIRRHGRDADHDHAVIGMGNRKIVGGPAVLAAQPLEAEYGDPLKTFGHIQCPPAAEVERTRRHMLGILRLVIGETEECLAHLCGRLVAERRVPGVEIAEPVQPVVGRTVERQHIELGFDQVDKRQESERLRPSL